ncbi:MAG: glycine cleavage system protein GcvH [Planctomycetia bacterium]|nr:glycine cleavage system protein GcvH [Planctomycetia bacterium]
MNTPKELRYCKSHEWVSQDGEICSVGITDFAQHAMGDIVYIKLPEVGDMAEKDSSFCDIESVKAVSEVYSPVSGEIIEVNTELENAPEMINSDPYGSWICKIRVSEFGELLSAEEYEKVCAEEN